MDLRTSYLGLPLAHPFMPGASPLVDDLGTVRRLEDAGASAIVMHSLFEEQLTGERDRTLHDLALQTGFAEATTSFFPGASEFTLGPVEYLEQLRRIKATVSVPVIGSLNGVTVSGWLEHAALIEQAGADALELNIYQVVTNGDEDAATVEGRIIEIVREVRRKIRIPLAVKLSPFHSALTHFARALEIAGANGLVLFNRFYQPDIDCEALEVLPRLVLSDPSELLLRLRWLAVLSGRVHLDLGCSGGVHGILDGVKAVLAGAAAVQTVSAILRHGPGQLTALRDGVSEWLDSHGYESLEQARGSMNLVHCPDPAAFERGNYVRILQSWKA